jgi:hypothetical protein
MFLLALWIAFGPAKSIGSRRATFTWFNLKLELEKESGWEVSKLTRNTKFNDNFEELPMTWTFFLTFKFF